MAAAAYLFFYYLTVYAELNICKLNKYGQHSVNE